LGINLRRVLIHKIQRPEWILNYKIAVIQVFSKSAVESGKRLSSTLGLKTWQKSSHKLFKWLIIIKKEVKWNFALT